MLCLTSGFGGVAAAQTVSNYTINAERQERIGQNHLRLIGDAEHPVELEQGMTKLYANEVEVFEDQDRAVATGNVVFTQGTNSIAADRADFNTKTKLGTFYHAYGITSIQQRVQRPAPGTVIVPTMTNQPTDVYFFGDVVEKTAPRKYKITNGGFSTCVQPTPRWDLHADTVYLNIDHYTLLKQAIFNVKGVPMLYVPVLLYPTKQNDRATGFLIPTYGSSSLRGQSLHNAFFWAIDRSQDATIMHDWYSKTGQAVGSEYRYNLGSGNGTVVGHYLEDKETTYSNGGVLPASKSFELNGAAYQALPHNLRARANVDYFSDIGTKQTFNTNLYDASNNRRTYGVNVVGFWRSVSLNGIFDRTENFYTTTSSTISGDTPRINLTRTDRPIVPRSPLYWSFGSEFVHFVRATHDATNGETDTGLSRVDFAPQLRYPLKRWQWFTVNSTMLFRDTFYTRSVDPLTQDVIDERLNRTYMTFNSQVIGPVFNKIWDTPQNHYAEKFKHTVEPVFGVGYTTLIKNFDSIVKTDGTDQTVGTTSFNYGINNRFYAKRKIGAISQAQEFLTVSLAQGYYTNNIAARFDPNYQTSLTTTQPSNFTPVRLDVRALPTNQVNATFHAEFDSHYHALRTTSVNASYNWTTRLQTNVGWTRTYFIKDLPGFNDPNSLAHAVNVQTSAQTRDNKYGMRYTFYYDILQGEMLQQTLIGFYNAQCCGIAFQYSPRKFGTNFSSLGTNQSFFISFTLAGLGNFSPLNGALGGVPR